MKIFQKLVSDNDHSSIYSGDDRICYSQLVEDSDKFNFFSDNKPLVFVVTKSSYDCLAGYVGLLNANAAVALVNNSIHQPVFNNLLVKFKPSLVYQPLNEFPCGKNWKQLLNFRGYVLYETDFEIDYEIRDELSLLLRTSGSTGSPEFVRLSYSNVCSNTRSICKYLKINNRDVAITTLPMSYSYGVSIINTHLFKGASLILTDTSLMEKTFWETIVRHKATTFGGVPYTFEMLKQLNFHKISLPAINYITQAGGDLGKELLEYFVEVCTEKEIDLIVMYGQTEASPRMSYLPQNIHQEKLGSIGVPVPGGKFHLIDEQCRVINESNVEGELIYEGENVCLGYARDCYDLAKGDLNNGVLATGDLAKVDPDGYYYLTGRKARFLKIFGNRINLDQIEQEFKEAGYDCACIGVDDQIEIFTTKENDIQGIQKYVVEHFGLKRSVFSVAHIKNIPRNDSGKIQYFELAS